MKELVTGVSIFIGGIIAVVSVMLILVGIISVFAYPFKAMSCHSKWEDSGHDTRYGIMSGCRVQLEDGTWVPEQRLINMRNAS